MKILDLQTGHIHEYGTNGHDSLYVSNDGKYLTYYNLQNGDGSGLGDYRFVCDDGKVPAESKTADAIHAEVYFNIGGWHNVRPQGEWIITKDEKFYHYQCPFCGFWATGDFLRTNGNLDLPNFCPNCGADMRGKKNDRK